MPQFTEVRYENKIKFNPPFVTDDPLILDKGYCHFNRTGLKDFIDCISAYAVEDNELIIRAGTWREESCLVKIGFISDTAYRLRMYPYEKEPERANSVYEFPAVAHFSVYEEEEFLIVSTDRLTLKIRKNPWEITTVLDGRELVKEQIQDLNVDQRYKSVPLGFSFENGTATDCFETMYMHRDESFYGFGEKFTQFDKRGQKITTWQRDAQSGDSDISYKGMPIFISSYGYMMILNTYTRNHFNMGANSGISYNLETEDSYLDYYVFCNRSHKGLLTDYTRLSGRAPMLPKFAFGYWQSKMVYHDREEIERVIAKFKELDIPIDTIHLDGTVWMDEEKDDLFEWSYKRFPGGEQFFKDMRDKGIHVSLWIYPYVSHYDDFGTFNTEDPTEPKLSRNFCYLEKMGYLVKNPEGKTYFFSVGEGNPSEAGIAAIDLTNPDARAYLKERLKYVAKLGPGILKTDFGEEVPADAVYYDGTTGIYTHNKYTKMYQQLFYEAFRERKAEMGDNEPAMLWGRSGYMGNHVNPANWAGDQNGALNTGFAILNAGLSIGMSGVPFWGYDLGGFYSADYEGRRAKPGDYEYIRSIQMGLFSPLSRCHAQATDREPWTYEKRTMEEFIKMDKIRYHLLPYLYTTASEACEKGWPIMRPMMMEFQDDYTVKSLSSQFMLGPSILVAPVFDREVQHVYLPAGSWTDFYTGERISGGRWITPEIRMDYMPVFIRENSAVFMLNKEIKHIKQEKWTDMSLILNLTDNTSGVFSDEGSKSNYFINFYDGKLYADIHDMDISNLKISSVKEIRTAYVNGDEWSVLDRGNWYEIRKR